MNKKKTIIITGALGQDGQILTKILLSKGYKVFGIINNYKNTKINNNINKKINLLNYNKTKLFIKKVNPSHIIHFGSKNPSFNNNTNYYTDNYLSTKNIIDSIIEVNNKIIFIFASSSLIFKKKRGVVTEEDQFKITSSYTKFRIKIFNYMKFLKEKKSFLFCNLILFNHDSIYRKDSFLIPRLISMIRKNDFSYLKKIYKENIIRDFSHAEDICYAIYLLIKKKICINSLILSSGKKTSVNKIINYLLVKHFNKKTIKTSKKSNNKYIVGNNSLAKNILNWKIKKNIFLAVDEMLNKVN